MPSFKEGDLVCHNLADLRKDDVFRITGIYDSIDYTLYTIRLVNKNIPFQRTCIYEEPKSKNNTFRKLTKLEKLLYVQN